MKTTVDARMLKGGGGGYKLKWENATHKEDCEFVIKGSDAFCEPFPTTLALTYDPCSFLKKTFLRPKVLCLNRRRWKILPTRIVYGSNTNCAWSFRCEDNNAYLICVESHCYRVRLVELCHREG